ncbi:MAG: SpoIIE family protein phosphatase [Clostridia bacterium]|nr:SpoIIE family protein phosphatase [Clostridia bacterium]
MEKQEVLKEEIKVEKAGRKQKLSKRDLVIEFGRAFIFFVFGLLLGAREMIFESIPLAYALLSSSIRQTPFVFLGILTSAFDGGKLSLVKIVGACAVICVRIVARLYLDKDRENSFNENGSSAPPIAQLFSEHTYLRVLSSALGVFFVGIWKIIEGGFRFYDLFGAIFYLLFTPTATWLFCHYFNINERKIREQSAFEITPRLERLYDISSVLLLCAFLFSLDKINLLGMSASIFFAVLFTLYAAKRGILYGIVAGLLFGLSISPTYAPTFAFCAIAYASIYKLSLFGAGIASCIAGLIWCIYVGGISSLATDFPALLSSSMLFCTAERINIFDDIERVLTHENEKEEHYCINSMIAEQKNSTRDEKLRSISDSFSNLSEIFYNLSSKLKRPTMLDLRSICENSFEKICENCEGRDLCYGAEYGATLDAMKKITVQLHSFGLVEEKKLPESFKKRCPNVKILSENINKSCSIATKKAFQNEKTEIFALDYDAISKILNDAISENEDDFKIDTSMSKRVAQVIEEEGYGNHNVSVFGKRKLRILARGLDLSDQAADVSTLKRRLEDETGVNLANPTFELSYGSVNMQTEAKRAYSAESAFSNVSSNGESVCGDTVSIFENKNDYFYALISDGMGTGKNAALTSEICNVFLRNMLNAGNKMETSLRMLNSVLRTKGASSEAECSATVDLLQFDLYTGDLTLVKSGAAPTFVVRRGNVFKLASPSFPIGILRAIDAKQLNIQCEDGDIIVMVSDGATRGGDDCSYLNSLLREQNIADEPPSKIADKIIRRAKAEIDMPNDDISVVVVKVKKEICNW